MRLIAILIEIIKTKDNSIRFIIIIKKTLVGIPLIFEL